MFCAIEGYVLLGEVTCTRILKEVLPYVNLESYHHIHKGGNFDYILCEANLVFGLSQRFIDKMVVLFAFVLLVVLILSHVSWKKNICFIGPFYLNILSQKRWKRYVSTKR